MLNIKSFGIFIASLIAIWSLIYLIFDITGWGVKIYDGELGNPFAWYLLMLASDLGMSLLILGNYYSDQKKLIENNQYQSPSFSYNIIYLVALMGIVYLNY